MLLESVLPFCSLIAALALVPAPRSLTVKSGDVSAAGVRIVESRDPAVPSEGYRLAVGTNGIAVVASDDAGAFYARETLKQLDEGGRYPCCMIEDAPAYRWRGVMIDEARHFLGKDAVKRLLDQMAAHKLNVLHWHLTDDQGWRIEIRRHPELVTYGAVRPRSVLYGCPTVWRSDGLYYELDNDPYGPFFYTQEEIREILAYAKSRHVTVVPEIELPGHVRALLAAHPEFSCKGELERIPRIYWCIEDEVLCVGNDAAIRFLEEVFDEICELFPDTPYIHIGGDECRRKRWKTCPKCQARMKDVGIAEETGLQSWVTAHFVRYLEQKGRRAVGWDEVLAGDVPRSTVGMSWRVGKKDGAGTTFMSVEEAARRGHDLVMTPNEVTYLSRPQGFRHDPYPYFTPNGPVIDLSDAYAFDPVKDLPPECRGRVIGGQASVWGEYIWNADDLEWKTWPRACAIAEALWTAPTKRDYDDFRRRMERHRGRLLDAGVNCAPLDRTAEDFGPRMKSMTGKLMPANGSTIACNSPKFTWRPVPKARRYHLDLSLDASFPTNATRTYDVGGFTSYQLEEPLEPGKWFWRVSRTNGETDAWPSSFVQAAPKERDCLAPIVLTRACRVVKGTEPFTVKVRDRGRPRVSVLGCEGVFRDSPDGVLEYVFNPPSGGWPKGFTETRIEAVDEAGNRAWSDFWFLNAPPPENPSRIGADGRFIEKGRRIFPLGIYEVEPKDFAEVRSNGFDVVHLYKWESSQDDVACRRYLDQCWQAGGLRAFVGFDRAAIVRGGFAAVARRVGALADHPGLFCWYLFDEPELADQFVSPNRLTAFADLVRALDPYHAVVMTTWGMWMNMYRRTWDTHWTQAYGNPREVVDILAEHRKLLKHASPITLLVSCNDIEQGRTWRKNRVKPDPAKFNRDYDLLRACAFLGIVKECNGIWWWWFGRDCPDYFSASQVPLAWESVCKVVRELNELKPLVNAEGKVRSGTVEVGKDKIEWWTKETPEGLELVAVNTADHPVETVIAVPGRDKLRHSFSRYEVWRTSLPFK